MIKKSYDYKEQPINEKLSKYLPVELVALNGSP